MEALWYWSAARHRLHTCLHISQFSSISLPPFYHDVNHTSEEL